MAIIGTFTKQDGAYAGSIATLTVKAKVNIAPVEKTGEKAPDFRVYSGKAEIGAAWSKRSNEGREYLSVKLDDPSFTQPIYANLFDAEDEQGYALIWSRSRKAGAE